jgi:16S rRNA processing protein RimM
VNNKISSELIYVAKLGKTVGLKGQLKLYIDSDFPEQFKKGAQFTTNKNTTLTVEQYNSKNDTIKFLDVDNIDDAKKLVTQQLFVTQEQTRENCNLNHKQFFWFDLVGSKVCEGDITLGTVKDIHRYPIDDYLEIKTSDELVKKEYAKSFLIPYNDNFIKEVDLNSKTIITINSYEILQNS